MAQKRSASKKPAARKPAPVLVVRLEEKLLLSPSEVVALTGIKRSKLFTMLARGEIASFKDGGLRFIPRSAILAYSDAKLASVAKQAPLAGTRPRVVPSGARARVA